MVIQKLVSALVQAAYLDTSNIYFLEFFRMKCTVKRCILITILMIISIIPLLIFGSLSLYIVIHFNFALYTSQKSAPILAILILNMLLVITNIIIGFNLKINYNKIHFSFYKIERSLFIFFINFIILILIVYYINANFMDFFYHVSVGIGSNIGAISLILALCIFGPISEELTFRGWLWDGLSRALPKWQVSIVTALMFYGVHLPHTIANAVGLIAPTIILTSIRYFCNSIRATITTHSCLNLISISLEYM